MVANHESNGNAIPKIASSISASLIENSGRRESAKSEPIYRTTVKMNDRFVTKLRSDFIDQ